jgi:hypothetical protein
MCADHLPAAPRRHGGGLPLRAAMARALPGDGSATVPVPVRQLAGPAGGVRPRPYRTAPASSLATCACVLVLFARDVVRSW